MITPNFKKFDIEAYKPGKSKVKKLKKVIKLSANESALGIGKKVRKVLKNLDEETLGELFSYFMLEISMIGLMNNSNPFDQPAVEQVKLLTKKKLL